MNQIYTAGYSGHTPAQLKTIADALGAFVADIRFSRRSRVPGWSGPELYEFFGDEIYNWLPRLGNRNYNGGGEIQIANLSGGMIQLVQMVKERPVILLCGCADHATCHRKHVADVMAQGGWNVQEVEWPEAAGLIQTISLWQPWASLIAIGAKRIETRGWSTNYRGPLAIHAAKTTGELFNCAYASFWSAFHRAGIWKIPDAVTENFPENQVRQTFLTDLSAKKRLEWLPLPLGALVAVCDLVDCVPVEELLPTLSPQERAFGNYGAGRFGWMLENVRALETPVSYRGAQGFFRVDRALLD